MRILAIDIGSTCRKGTKSYSTCLDTETGVIERSSCPTTPEALLAHLGAYRPNRVVIEQTVGTGWIVDLCRGSGIEQVQVLNPRDAAWKNRNTKTDRHDADLLAHLSASGQASTVHVPEDRVRQWRVLIDYRHELVRRRTRIKNRIKALLRNRGMMTNQLWTKEGRSNLESKAKPIESCSIENLWRGELHTELAQLSAILDHLSAITKRLDHLVEICAPAKVMAELEGIGPRTAEAMVATIDDPLRFLNRKKIGGYFGMVPSVRQSGSSCRHGGITKTGNSVVRAVLTQVVMSAIRLKKGWIYDIYVKLHHSQEHGVQRAVTATVRRIAVILWAKFRDYRKSHLQEPLFDLRCSA